MMEQVQWRVLGAVRPLDAVTGIRVLRPLAISPPAGVTGVRNQSGMWVITGAPGMESVVHSIQPPPFNPPAPQPVVFTVSDPQGVYLPRRLVVRLPRDPNPANQAHADSLFRPVDAAMYPGPTSPVSPRWAVIRTTVKGRQPGSVAPGALIRVLHNNVVIARGVADARGEALVAIPGIPITMWSVAPSTKVITTTVFLVVQVIWDEAAAGLLPDPDDLEKRSGLPALKLREAGITLASGQQVVMRDAEWAVSPVPPPNPPGNSPGTGTGTGTGGGGTGGGTGGGSGGTGGGGTGGGGTGGGGTGGGGTGGGQGQGGGPNR